MKAPVLLLFHLLSVTLIAQDKDVPFDGHTWKAPYHLPTPKDWSVERFLLPPFFAPAITYKGVEDIRFTPGWAKKETDEYWTYAFLWFLDEMPSLDDKKIESHLAAYYTGLYKVNTDSNRHKTMQPVKATFKAANAKPGRYTGTIIMTDYMTHQLITLNCKVQSKKCEDTGKAFIFFELSPKPFAHTVWTSLDKLWKEFRCKELISQ